MPASVSRAYVVVDGVTLAYEDYGEGDAVVFVHGFPASSYSWRTVARSLGGQNRTICFDLMGFGHSDKPRADDYGFARQAELITGALDQLRVDNAILAGHSIGGAICLAAARQLGPGLKGLVLVNSVCYPQRLPWFIQALRVPVLPEIVMKLIPERCGFRLLERWMYHPKNGMSPDAMREYADRLQSEGAHAAMLAVARHLIPKDIDSFTASYRQISVPTLVIWGADDRTIPCAFAHRLAGDIRNTQVHLVDECGHCPQEEKPKEVAELIRQFLQDACNA